MRRLWVALLAVASLPRDASACGWDSETVFAEATTLPCVYDAIFGRFARHTREYYDARIAAADAALEWSPTSVDALDMKAIAQLRLGELEGARKTMNARAAIEPDAYATHANLGTLLTFTGELDEAIRHIDAAMKLEPAAHFGREKWHRALVVHLRDRKTDPSLNDQSFIGPRPTDEQLVRGTKSSFTGDPRVFDALVSMIAVYGADKLPEVYYALGEQLALRGDRYMAIAAYQRAIDLKHPAAKSIEALLPKFLKFLPVAPGGYGFELDMASRMQKDYAFWEKTRVTVLNAPVWRDEGVKEIYDKQHWYRRRCLAPEVIRDARAPEGELPPPPKKPRAPSYADKPLPSTGLP